MCSILILIIGLIQIVFLNKVYNFKNVYDRKRPKNKLEKKELCIMTISPSDREAKKVRVLVDRDPVETSFAKFATPGHFSRTLAMSFINNLGLGLTCGCS